MQGGLIEKRIDVALEMIGKKKTGWDSKGTASAQIHFLALLTEPTCPYREVLVPETQTHCPHGNLDENIHSNIKKIKK